MSQIRNRTATAATNVIAAAMVMTMWFLTMIVGGRVEPVDERGGGRNTDEGFHISGGAVLATAIATGIGAFVANKLGVLK